MRMAGSQLIGIVDDDFAVREALTDFVLSLGHQAVSYPSGESFLDDKSRNEYAVLLVDLNMHGMNGLDVLHKLRATGDLTPAAIMTSYSGTYVRNEAFAAGAVGFLEKPFDAAALSACIEQATRPKSSVP
jgi:FixJ family two-component response regulator